jgi:fido (protein-threonine AMPylation protein)
MPKKLLENLLEPIQATLAKHPDGASIEKIVNGLAGRISRRSLQRRLAAWVADGQIRATGSMKGRKYLLSPVPVPPRRVHTAAQELQPEQNSSFVDPSVRDDYPPLSSTGREVLSLVRRPLFDRPPVGYQRTFLDSYVPNTTAYLPNAAVEHLHDIGKTGATDQLAGTFARDILDRLLIDLSWASSQLEGNTYSLLDTERLIRAGEAAVGKNAKETQMILNHKAAIELLVNPADEIGVNQFTICNLHALLSENLLDSPQDAGRLRVSPVGVGGTTYTSTAIPQLIEEMFAQLLAKATAIRDPFEQALFLMVQLPYLQPFIDVNKRTSRLAANIPLIKRNLAPLSFVGVPVRAYTDGVLAVYEFNRVELLRDVFVWAYERSSQQYITVRDSLPEPDPFRLRYRTAQREVIGAIVKEQLTLTVEAIREQAGSLVNANDLERFCDVVQQDLHGLHEGNIARYGLRPSEFRAWQTNRTSVNVAKT